MPKPRPDAEKTEVLNIMLNVLREQVDPECGTVRIRIDRLVSPTVRLEDGRSVENYQSQYLIQQLRVLGVLVWISTGVWWVDTTDRMITKAEVTALHTFIPARKTIASVLEYISRRAYEAEAEATSLRERNEMLQIKLDQARDRSRRLITSS